MSNYGDKYKQNVEQNKTPVIRAYQELTERLNNTKNTTYTITSLTEWWGMYAWDTSYSDIGIPNNAKIISVYIGTCSDNAPLCATRFYNTSATNIRVIFSRNNPTTFTLCVCYLVG